MKSIETVTQRYINILGDKDVRQEFNQDNPTSLGHLMWMLITIKYNDDNMSDTKRHRWLGYIQGCLTCHGIIVVKDEMEITRSIFKGE